MNEKITLKEFFESKELLCIHCDTEEKANKLLQEFNKLGKTWNNGKSYLTDNCWDFNKEDTIYYNDNSYGCVDTAKNFDFEIYEFEDVIFEDSNNKYEKDKIAFNNILKTMVKLQKNIKQPTYVIARYWLGEFQGIEKTITVDGDNDLEEIKQIFKDKYASDCHSFGITEVSYKILKIDISEVLK